MALPAAQYTYYSDTSGGHRCQHWPRAFLNFCSMSLKDEGDFLVHLESVVSMIQFRVL